MSFDLPTFAFQTINFVVLVIVLWRLLFRPLRAHMQRRSQSIERALDELREEREAVAERRGAAEARMSEAQRAEEEAIARAERAADERRSELLEEAHRAAELERERMLVEMRREKERREREFLESLEPVALRVLQRLLEELAEPAALHRGLCARFAERLAAMSAEERAALSEAGAAEGVELVLGRDELPESLRSALDPLVEVPQAPRVDPSLVAGVRLRAGDRVYDGSAVAQVRRVIEAAR